MPKSLARMLTGDIRKAASPWRKASTLLPSTVPELLETQVPDTQDDTESLADSDPESPVIGVDLSFAASGYDGVRAQPKVQRSIPQHIRVRDGTDLEHDLCRQRSNVNPRLKQRLRAFDRRVAVPRVPREPKEFNEKTADDHPSMKALRANGTMRRQRTRRMYTLTSECAADLEQRILFSVVRCSSEKPGFHSSCLTEPEIDIPCIAGVTWETAAGHRCNEYVTLELHDGPAIVTGVSVALPGTKANPRSVCLQYSEESPDGPFHHAWGFMVPPMIEGEHEYWEPKDEAGDDSSVSPCTCPASWWRLLILDNWGAPSLALQSPLRLFKAREGGSTPPGTPRGASKLQGLHISKGRKGAFGRLGGTEEDMTEEELVQQQVAYEYGVPLTEVSAMYRDFEKVAAKDALRTILAVAASGGLNDLEKDGLKRINRQEFERLFYWLKTKKQSRALPEGFFDKGWQEACGEEKPSGARRLTFKEFMAWYKQHIPDFRAPPGTPDADAVLSFRIAPSGAGIDQGEHSPSSKMLGAALSAKHVASGWHKLHHHATKRWNSKKEKDPSAKGKLLVKAMNSAIGFARAGHAHEIERMKGTAEEIDAEDEAVVDDLTAPPGTSTIGARKSVVSSFVAESIAAASAAAAATAAPGPAKLGARKSVTPSLVVGLQGDNSPRRGKVGARKSVAPFLAAGSQEDSSSNPESRKSKTASALRAAAASARTSTMGARYADPASKGTALAAVAETAGAGAQPVHDSPRAEASTGNTAQTARSTSHGSLASTLANSGLPETLLPAAAFAPQKAAAASLSAAMAPPGRRRSSLVAPESPRARQTKISLATSGWSMK